MIDELADENAGSVKVVKVNIDEAGELAQQYGVSSIPTLMIFKGGEVQLNSWVHSQNRPFRKLWTRQRVRLDFQQADFLKNTERPD